MKRSITRWTMAVTTAGVLSLPVSSFARTTQDPQPQPQPQQQQQQPAQPQPQPQQQPQQPQPQPTPQPQQPTPTPQPSASTTQAQGDKTLTPQDHLKKAQEAASDISTTSVPSKNRAALEQLKRHLSNLDKVSSSSTATPTETAKKDSDAAKGSGQMNWGTEVAAIDKIIGEMVASESSPSATPSPTGTSGTTAKSATTLDDATRAKLMEVRSHITAYAAGMAGTSTPKTEAAASTETPAARPDPSTTPAPTQPPTEPPAQAAPPAQNPTPTPSPSPAQPDPNAAQPAQPPAGQPSPTNQAPAAQTPPTQQADTGAAHQLLVAARDTLAQLTQLPAAAQLNGEARNQVSQLITNFNQLISTQSNWRASYDRVNANLTTLLGPDNSDTEAAAGAPTTNAAATATPGAVGTAGTASVELDPTIRAKLVDLRKNLNEFRKAAEGK